MRIRFCVLLFFMMGCLVAACSPGSESVRPSEDVLNFHRRFSVYTDPGEHAALLDGLPEPLDDLCALIKRQLIHPFDAEEFVNQLPRDCSIEDQNLPTVSLMLTELVKRDGRGLITDRAPRDRLIVACVHHSMLLASILRHRGIPVRIRAGFANYIKPGSNLRVSHVVCEVWDLRRQKWILVDPDRERVDLPRCDFLLASQMWHLVRRDALGTEPYLSSYGSVARATVHLLCHDLSYVIGQERPYWEDPPVVFSLDSDILELGEDQLIMLDRLATLLEHPDEHLAELAAMQNELEDLQYDTE